MILIVDDYADACRKIAKLIQRLGKQNACVTDLYQVIESMTRLRPTLVILDEMMPRMTGISCSG